MFSDGATYTPGSDPIVDGRHKDKIMGFAEILSIEGFWN